MADMLANCLHTLDALGPAGLPALMGALFLMGLAGGASHCAAMCGPFVLAQAAAGQGLEGGRLARLSGALLLEHLGLDDAARAVEEAVVADLADRVAVWAQGRIAALGSPAEILADPEVQRNVIGIARPARAPGERPAHA